MKVLRLFGNDNNKDEYNCDLDPENIFYDVIDGINEVREGDCNKGTFGTIACICGSYGMAGAAMLCGSAAMTCGTGIVKMIVPDKIYPIAAANLWESVFVPLSTSKDGTLCADEIDKILEACEGCSAVVIGCGLKVTEDTEKIVTALFSECTKPIILDADGINCLSKHIDVLSKRNAPTILTPHPGEMARLNNCTVAQIQSNRQKIAVEFAKTYGCTLVLKGVKTIVTDGERISVNPTGDGSLAKGGSGDVLAGIIGSFVSQGVEIFKAAVAGAYIHGEAAEECSNEYSMSCVSARDVIHAIKYLM